MATPAAATDKMANIAPIGMYTVRAIWKIIRYFSIIPCISLEHEKQEMIAHIISQIVQYVDHCE